MAKISMSTASAAGISPLRQAVCQKSDFQNSRISPFYEYPETPVRCARVSLLYQQQYVDKLLTFGGTLGKPAEVVLGSKHACHAGTRINLPPD